MEARLTDANGRGSRGDERLALAALGFLLLVTVVWWVTALWPVPATAPDWLQSARAVCFGAVHDGLPDAGGWILLIGEPLGMAAALYLVWRESLMRGIRGLATRPWGRAAIGVVGLVLLTGIGGALWRIDAVRGLNGRPPGPAAAASATGPEPALRLDVAAPGLRLVDQHGDTLSLDRFAGDPVLVTFAYGHCETVCPLIVRDALAARRQLGGEAPPLVIVTLDPWRDTPGRLPHLAATWEVGTDAYVVSGEPDEVQAVLAEWEVESLRDLRTGEITHAPTTFLIDRGGRAAYRTTGRAAELVRLARTLQ